jgi:hypothetical protein
MDEDRPSISPPDLYARLGVDAAPTGPGVRRPVDLEDKLAVPARDQVERRSVNPLRESSVVVYFGDKQQVCEGFAIALRAMGPEANLFLEDIALPGNSNREDN